MTVTRRSALKIGALGVAGAGALTVPLGGGVTAKSASQLPANLMPRPYGTAFQRPPDLVPNASGTNADGQKSVKYVVEQRGGTARILPTLDTPVFGYNGLVPGPTVTVDQGTKVSMTMRNKLPATHPQFGHNFASSTHLHGNASLPQYDGYAADITAPGSVKTYEWPMTSQPARTLWYHDHASHTTSQNVYSGLAAQFHVHDPAERALLPQGDFDVPLTISDAMFAADGSLGYDDRDHSGLYGDVILVNGRPWPVMPVQRRIYRFRILNGSISRAYRPTLFPQGAMHVVATDGGLMPQSQQVTQWRHGVAERYEVLIDFRQYQEGQRVELRNLSNKNNRDFDHTNKIMAFDVVGGTPDTSGPAATVVPQTLVSSVAMSLKPGMSKRVRRMELKKSDLTGVWSINGRSWADIVASGYKEVFANPGLGDVEIWEIKNNSGGWNHPLHIHLIDFQILTRNGRAAFAYEKGPKDVVYMGEGETVRLLMKFAPNKGKYMIHCHNLPHEDHDMMVQYSVGLNGVDIDPNDPITADPPKPDVD